MIDSLRGEIAEKGVGHAVVECHGVGYLVQLSTGTVGALSHKGACKLYVHYAVSMDVRSGQSEHKLFGFLEREERRLFRQLIEVQGVSSTIGMAIMGARPVAELESAIIQGDETALKSGPSPTR
jgi:Holliday junction DNA helicase RuvA